MLSGAECFQLTEYSLCLEFHYRTISVRHVVVHLTATPHLPQCACRTGYESFLMNVSQNFIPGSVHITINSLNPDPKQNCLKLNYKLNSFIQAMWPMDKCRHTHTYMCIAIYPSIYTLATKFAVRFHALVSQFNAFLIQKKLHFRAFF